jgi:hypothetical protein
MIARSMVAVWSNAALGRERARLRSAVAAV